MDYIIYISKYCTTECLAEYEIFYTMKSLKLSFWKCYSANK